MCLDTSSSVHFIRTYTYIRSTETSVYVRTYVCMYVCNYTWTCHIHVHPCTHRHTHSNSLSFAISSALQRYSTLPPSPSLSAMAVYSLRRCSQAISCSPSPLSVCHLCRRASW